MTARAILAALVALLLAGCGPWGLRAGVVLPDGTEPYVEIRFGDNPATERVVRNAAAAAPENAEAD